MKHIVVEILNNRIVGCMPFERVEDAQRRFNLLCSCRDATDDLTADERLEGNVFSFENGSVTLYSLYQ